MGGYAGEACVHSINSFVASPGGQPDLLSSVKSSCSVVVPVSIPSVAVSVRSFSSLALVSRVATAVGPTADRIAASSRPSRSGLRVLLNARGFSYWL